MSKHTPGPWTIDFEPFTRSEEHGGGPALSARVYGAGPVYRGSVVSMQDAGHIEGITSDELRANAKLVAAAPDLLAALRSARDGLKWYQDRFPEAIDGSDDEAMDEIDRAITKAEGRA